MLKPRYLHLAQNAHLVVVHAHPDAPDQHGFFLRCSCEKRSSISFSFHHSTVAGSRDLFVFFYTSFDTPSPISIVHDPLSIVSPRTPRRKKKQELLQKLVLLLTRGPQSRGGKQRITHSSFREKTREKRGREWERECQTQEKKTPTKQTKWLGAREEQEWIEEAVFFLHEHVFGDEESFPAIGPPSISPSLPIKTITKEEKRYHPS